MVRLFLPPRPCLRVQHGPDLRSATYSAFCRNYGNHMTAATRVRRCWNDEAMQAMVTRMERPWQDFRQTMLRLEEGVSEAIETSFDRAIAQCTPSGPSRTPTRGGGFPTQSNSHANGASATPAGIAPNSLRTLTLTLRHRQAMLVTQVEDLCGEFEQGVS